jgi:hypothetical protein
MTERQSSEIYYRYSTIHDSREHDKVPADATYEGTPQANLEALKNLKVQIGRIDRCKQREWKQDSEKFWNKGRVSVALLLCMSLDVVLT